MQVRLRFLQLQRLVGIVGPADKSFDPSIRNAAKALLVFPLFTVDSPSCSQNILNPVLIDPALISSNTMTGSIKTPIDPISA